MADIIIKTDRKWKNFKYGYELPKKWRKEFDWMNDEEYEVGCFLIYRNWAYSLLDFLRVEHNSDLKGWHGYSSDTYFSGVVIRLSEDGEQYMIGTYFS
jgi:hypothetical protein